MMKMILVAHPTAEGSWAIRRGRKAIERGNRYFIEQSEIGDDVLLVVDRDPRVGWRQVIDIWIERGGLHRGIFNADHDCSTLRRVLDLIERCKIDGNPQEVFAAVEQNPPTWLAKSVLDVSNEVGTPAQWEVKDQWAGQSVLGGLATSEHLEGKRRSGLVDGQITSARDCFILSVDAAGFQIALDIGPQATTSDGGRKMDQLPPGFHGSAG
jgi:hypothetical protein